MYIQKRYLLALALVGALLFGFGSHLIADRLGTGESSPPGSVADQPVVAGSPVVVQPGPSGAPVPAPIVAQPGGGGSTTNIYLTIVNTPAGTTTVPPQVNVVPRP